MPLDPLNDKVGELLGLLDRCKVLLPRLVQVDDRGNLIGSALVFGQVLLHRGVQHNFSFLSLIWLLRDSL